MILRCFQISKINQINQISTREHSYDDGLSKLQYISYLCYGLSLHDLTIKSIPNTTEHPLKIAAHNYNTFHTCVLDCLDVILKYFPY